MSDQKVSSQSSDPDVEHLDSEGIKQLNRIDKHHIRLRRFAVFIAIVIILATCWLELEILDRLDGWKEIGNFVALLGIAPIVSITAIVIFILIGAFKQPGDAEVSLSSLLQAMQSVSGND